jgi:hypothetical protein
LLPDDKRTLFRFKSRDQTDFFLRAADFVPRQPNAIGSAELRRRFLLCQLFGRNDVPTRRRRLVWLAVGLVERVHDQLAIDPHGVFRILFEEHQSAAEAALRRLPGGIEHRVGPGGDQAHRSFRIGLLRLDADGTLQVPLGEFPAF